MLKRAKVLVIDSDETVRKLLYNALSQDGHRVVLASRGEEGIEKVKQDKFSIVIIDMEILGMGGFEVLKQIKELNPDICAIITSRYSSADSEINAIRQGAYDYLLKPFSSPEEVRLAIKRAAERQHLMQEARQKEFYRELAILDGLTGVYNYRYLHELLPREIERAKRYKYTLCFMMLDIDDFKLHNDKMGHLEGDKLLSAFARTMAGALRSADVFFRYGGEEFVVLCPQTNREGGIELARRLLDVTVKNFPFSISIGLACYPEDAEDKEDLINKGDTMLYQAKRLGKNRLCVFGQDNS